MVLAPVAGQMQLATIRNRTNSPVKREVGSRQPVLPAALPRGLAQVRVID